MRSEVSNIEALVHEAFGLLLEIRGRRDASRHLAHAIHCLKMLAREGDTSQSLMVVSVRALPLSKD